MGLRIADDNARQGANSRASSRAPPESWQISASENGEILGAEYLLITAGNCPRPRTLPVGPPRALPLPRAPPSAPVLDHIDDRLQVLRLRPAVEDLALEPGLLRRFPGDLEVRALVDEDVHERRREPVLSVAPIVRVRTPLAARIQ